MGSSARPLLVVVLQALLGHLAEGSDWRSMENTTNHYHRATNQQRVTWYRARAYCMSLGADLASLHSQQELDFLKNTFPSGSVWIGLNKLDREAFRWSDGSNSSFSSWEEGQPEEGATGKWCVKMEIADGEWKTANCGTKSGVLCKRDYSSVSPTPKTDPLTSPAPGYCPPGYIDAETKCYGIFHELLPWTEALTRCRAQPGLLPDLASFHSYRDNAFVTSHLPSKSEPLWIGQRQAEDIFSWHWSDNSDTDFENDVGDFANGKCKAMVSSRPLIPGMWQRKDCNSKLGFVCQTHKDPENVISTASPTPAHNCEDGFTPYRDQCYRLHTEAVTWSEARKRCEAEGSHLAAIHSEGENAAILTWSSPRDTWIGLKRGASGEFEWANGWHVSYVRWEGSTATGDCVQMLGQKGTWRSVDCGMELPFICKTSDMALTTPPHFDGKCPAEGGWIPHGSDCYLIQLGTPQTSWFGAIEGCISHSQNARLASIHHLVENDWLYKEVRKASGIFKQDVWIGLHRSKSDGAFRWHDGSPVQFTDWELGRPTDGSCAILVKDMGGLWRDVDCESPSRGYVCKVAKVARPSHPPVVPGECPDDTWESYASSCFLYRPDEFLRWFEAQELCLRYGGYLASILAENENDFLHERMLANTHLPKHRPFWIGANRFNSTTLYHWLDNIPMVYSHWGKGYPKAGYGDCVMVDPDTAVWSNNWCDQRAGVVCRFDKVLSSTAGGPVNEGLPPGVVAAISICAVLVVVLSVCISYLLYQRIYHPVPHTNFDNPLRPTSPSESDLTPPNGSATVTQA